MRPDRSRRALASSVLRQDAVGDAGPRRSASPAHQHVFGHALTVTAGSDTGHREVHGDQNGLPVEAPGDREVSRTSHSTRVRNLSHRRRPSAARSLPREHQEPRSTSDTPSSRRTSSGPAPGRARAAVRLSGHGPRTRLQDRGQRLLAGRGCRRRGRGDGPRAVDLVRDWYEQGTTVEPRTAEVPSIAPGLVTDHASPMLSELSTNACYPPDRGLDRPAPGSCGSV